MALTILAVLIFLGIAMIDSKLAKLLKEQKRHHKVIEGK